MKNCIKAILKFWILGFIYVSVQANPPEEERRPKKVNVSQGFHEEWYMPLERAYLVELTCHGGQIERTLNPDNPQEKEMTEARRRIFGDTREAYVLKEERRVRALELTCISRLMTLQTLILKNGVLLDSDPLHLLGTLQNLKTVDVSNNLCIGNYIARLAQNWPHIEQMNLSRTDLSEEGASFLPFCIQDGKILPRQSLISLDVSFNLCLGNSGVRALCALYSLKELDVSRCGIFTEVWRFPHGSQFPGVYDETDNIAWDLSRLVGLNSLKIGANFNMKDKALELLSRALSCLTFLDVFATDVSIKSLKFLKQFPQLKKVDLRDNPQIWDSSVEAHLRVYGQELGVEVIQGVKWMTSFSRPASQQVGAQAEGRDPQEKGLQEIQEGAAAVASPCTPQRNTGVKSPMGLWAQYNPFKDSK